MRWRALDANAKAASDGAPEVVQATNLQFWEDTPMAKPILRHVIEGARAYVAGRGTWTRYTLAATSRGRECEPTDERARRFCAYGALVRAAYDLTRDPDEARHLAGRAAMRLTASGTPDEAFEKIYTINDGQPESSRKAVLSLFDEGLAQV
jgi:hypothetical protein